MDNTSILAHTILGASSRSPVETLPDEICLATEAEAYHVQDLINAELGGVGGWKVARAPDGVFRCSAIPRSRIFRTGTHSPHTAPPGARIEFEIGLRFCKTVNADNLPRQPGDLTGLIDAVFPAIEIVTSRLSSELQGRQHFQLADHQNCLMIIADPHPFRSNLSGILRLNVSAGGEQRTVVVDQEQLARIQQAVIWLCEHALKRNRPIREDDTIITGALIGPEPLHSGRDYAIAVDDHPAVKSRFSL